MSTKESPQTWRAIEYSSKRASSVMWNRSGSSELNDTLRPRLKNCERKDEFDSNCERRSKFDNKDESIVITFRKGC